jgi:hypothetical protein
MLVSIHMSTHVHRGDRDHANDGGAMPGHVSERCQVDLIRKKMLLKQPRPPDCLLSHQTQVRVDCCKHPSQNRL